MRPQRTGPIAAAIMAVIRGFIWLTAWGVLGFICFFLRPPRALGWIVLTLAALLLYPFALPVRRRRRRAATLGLRGLGSGARWLGLAVPAALLTTLFSAAIMARLTTEPGPGLVDYRYAGLPLGALVFPLWGITLEPVVEEFGLRGFVQGGVARRAGPAVAVTVAAAVFACLHGSAVYLFYYFAAGVLYGYARVTTRSIMAPIALHVADNGMLIALPAVFLGFSSWADKRPATVLILGLVAAAALAVAGLRAMGISARSHGPAAEATTVTCIS